LKVREKIFLVGFLQANDVFHHVYILHEPAFYDAFLAGVLLYNYTHAPVVLVYFNVCPIRALFNSWRVTTHVVDRVVKYLLKAVDFDLR